MNDDQESQMNVDEECQMGWTEAVSDRFKRLQGDVFEIARFKRLQGYVIKILCVYIGRFKKLQGNVFKIGT